MSLAAEDQTFIELVKSFCEAVEAPPEYPTRGALHSIREALVALYAAVLVLPDFYDADDEDSPHYAHVDDDLFEIEDNISTCTGIDSFWLFYEPFGSPLSHPICSSLSDDLAQIWQGLKPGLLALEENEDRWMANVFQEWKHNFYTNWGDHAVDSIWAIHKLLRDAPPELIS